MERVDNIFLRSLVNRVESCIIMSKTFSQINENKHYLPQHMQDERKRLGLDEPNDLVAPLPITKQVLSEEEFNATQNSQDRNGNAVSGPYNNFSGVVLSKS